VHGTNGISDLFSCCSEQQLQGSDGPMWSVHFKRIGRFHSLKAFYEEILNVIGREVALIVFLIDNYGLY